MIDYKKWLDDCRTNRIELYQFDYAEINGHILRLFKVYPKRYNGKNIGLFCVWDNDFMYIYDTIFGAQKAFRLFEIGYETGVIK